MAVKLRLSRHGTTNAPFYWLVSADTRSPRDGRYLEKLGTYNPTLANENPERLKLNKTRIEYWLSVGAKPSNRAIKLLELGGIEDISKFINKNKSTIWKPKTTKNPDKMGGTKATSEAAANSDDNAKTTEEKPAEEKKVEAKSEDTNQESKKETTTSAEKKEESNETQNSDSTQSE